MSKFNEFIFRATKRTIKLAIVESEHKYLDSLPKLIKDKIKLLSIRMGEVLLETGYRDFSKEEVVFEESNYRRQIGIGIFLEAEKFDDIKGFLYACLKETEEKMNLNASLIRKINDYDDWIKDRHLRDYFETWKKEQYEVDET